MAGKTTKQTPLILQSALTKRWYVVTKYKPCNDDNDTIIASEKYDVTDQINRIIALYIK